MTRQLLLYMPVVHRGYEAFIFKHGPGSEVLLIGASFAQHYPAVRKDIRALDPHTAARYVLAGHPQVAGVRVVEVEDLPDAVVGPVLVTPDESLMRDIARRFKFRSRGVTTRYEPTFLRWDRRWSQATRPPEYAGRVTQEQASTRFARAALDIAQQSSDWWRQVGAIAVRDGEVVLQSHNEHWPTPYSPYVNGDPRDGFSRGVAADLSTALHAEAAIVATAARDGVSLARADLYVSTFPCPACARLVAAAGFARCFFSGGYSILDGEAVLQAAGVELYYVEPEAQSEEQLTLRDAETSRALGL